ncbi:MAG: HmuY family protein [Cyclobacteriaceae bacterium]|nr:hypothetical protein [Cyclobacteriaceae bacterium]MCH8515895.1 HmuY family protein [Cyclobacteriaceae bacterium]
MNRLKITFLSMAAIAMLCFTGCGDDDELQMQPNLVAFESASLGLDGAQSRDIRINLNRAAERSGMIRIAKVEEGVTEGEHYRLSPEAEDGIISLTVEEGATSASFNITLVEGALFEGDEKLTFTLEELSEPLNMGATTLLELSFGQIISDGGEFTIEGGGSQFPNAVFVHLASNQQFAFERQSWDLEFFSGSENRVFVNGAMPIMARRLDKNDLDAVSAADTVNFRNEMIVGPASSPAAAAWIDNPDGSLSGTAINEISSNDADNQVYIINLSMTNPSGDPSVPQTSRGWKKIRVLQNGNGYTLQHADINDDSFEEVNISKSNSHSKVYFSFENGIQEIAPRDERWDFVWTAYSNIIPFQGAQLPYFFQDIVNHNIHGGVGIATVMTDDISFEEFGASDIASLSFESSNQQAIGSSWRAGGGPGQGPTVREDRFYIVRNADGNHYKLRFESLTTNGERGRPQISYLLLD